MAEYLAEVRRMEKFFDGFKVWYVQHLDNRIAGHLAWIASSRPPTLPDVIVVKFPIPSIKPAEPISEADLLVIDRHDQEPVFDWINPTRHYQMTMPKSSISHAKPRCIT
jgi:hypothetical protein